MAAKSSTRCTKGWVATPNCSRPGKEDMPDGMWGRIIGYWGHRDGDPVGIFGRDGPAFDYDFGALQTGMDFYRNEYENGQRDNAGLYLAVGPG